MPLRRWLDCIVWWQGVPCSYLVTYSWAQLIRECIKRRNITPCQRATCIVQVWKLIEDEEYGNSKLFFHQHSPHNRYIQNQHRRSQIHPIYCRNLYILSFSEWQWRDALEQFLACFRILNAVYHKFKGAAKCACVHKFMNALRALSPSPYRTCMEVCGRCECVSVCESDADARMRIWLNRFYLCWRILCHLLLRNNIRSNWPGLCAERFLKKEHFTSSKLQF